jgi:hypothetical protein
MADAVELVADVFINSDDPERPFDGHYYDLNHVPWYARTPYEERIAYTGSLRGGRVMMRRGGRNTPRHITKIRPIALEFRN